MPDTEKFFAPGVYKFTVKNTAEAVALIRERLGPTARVVSVRTVPAAGLKKFLAAPRIEVVAQVDPATVETGPGSALNAVSSESAVPADENSVTTEGALRPRLVPLPASLGLDGLLRRSGITETALTRLQAGANWKELSTLPLHRALAETSRLLRSQAETRAVPSSRMPLTCGLSLKSMPIR